MGSFQLKTKATGEGKKTSYIHKGGLKKFSKT